MSLEQLISDLVIDTKGPGAGLWAVPSPDSSLGAFLPELILCATMVVLLLLRLVTSGRRAPAFLITLLGSCLALYAAAPWQHLQGPVQALTDPATVSRMEIFTGMLVYDPFTVFMRSLLLGFVVLFVLLTWLTGVPDREDGPDIYTLVLGATLGMCLMASANHLMMVFLAMEMASVPSYALAGMFKGRREASEAALKYSVYGAGAAGVMLYGISLVAGILDTAHLPTLAVRLGERLGTLPGEELMVLALAGLMIMVGLAFKLSAVPFHFWCPDVFEGASAEVNAFLSVASKAAALALLIRVAMGFGAVPPEGFRPGERTLAAMADAEAAEAAAAAAKTTAEPGLQPAAAAKTTAEPGPQPAAAAKTTAEPGPQPAAAAKTTAESGAVLAEVALNSPSGLFSVSAQEHAEDAPAAATPAALTASLGLSRSYIAKLIAFLAVLTCTFGNLTAYGQTNIKRLLAYSTIAHAGYMMMPVSAVMAMAGIAPRAAEDAVGAVAVYMVVYLFMNLGAFAIVALLRNAMHSEEIADYRGLLRTCPLTVVCFSLILFSLVGLPPLSGFIGKFAIFAALVDGYQLTAAAGAPATYLLALLIIGGINTAISLVYYLRVVKVMTMDPEPEDRRPFVFPEVSLQGAYLLLITAPTALWMLQWSSLHELCLAAARHLLSV